MSNTKICFWLEKTVRSLLNVIESLCRVFSSLRIETEDGLRCLRKRDNQLQRKLYRNPQPEININTNAANVIEGRQVIFRSLSVIFQLLLGATHEC